MYIYIVIYIYISLSLHICILGEEGWEREMGIGDGEEEYRSFPLQL